MTDGSIICYNTIMAEFQFFLYGAETWEGMLDALKSAKDSIDIEHYIFEGDSIGAQFLKVLKEKANKGVKVRLLLDAVGSFPLYSSSTPQELRRAGIEVRFWNPISPWRVHNFTSWFFRDHTKIIVVDGKIGFTGGLGVSAKMAKWRDTNVRVVGEPVPEMARSFENMWQISGGPAWRARIKLSSAQSQKNYVINAPYFKKRFLYHAFVRALEGAQKSICISNSYFVPDGKIIRELVRAQRRGVDVKIIVPQTFDVLIVGTATECTFELLLKKGIKIFRYESEFLHAKVAVVDRAWATLGSFNLDFQSFLYNFEGNIISTERNCVDALREQFQTDLNQSREVTLAHWRERPFTRKLAEFFIGPIRGLF